MLGRLLIAVCLCGLTAGVAASPVEQRPIIIGGDAHYAPLEYLEDGEPKGLVIDILKAMERETGLAFAIRLGDWAAVQKEMLDGRIDVLAVIAATEERKELYDFSKETIQLTYSLFCRQDDLRLRGPEDMRGM